MEKEFKRIGTKNKTFSEIQDLRIEYQSLEDRRYETARYLYETLEQGVIQKPKGFFKLKCPLCNHVLPSPIKIEKEYRFRYFYYECSNCDYECAIQKL